MTKMSLTVGQNVCYDYSKSIIAGGSFIKDGILYTILHDYSNNLEVTCRIAEGENVGELRCFEAKEVHKHVIEFTRSLFSNYFFDYLIALINI